MVPPLPPITLSQYSAVIRTYKPKAGLGADCVNPRSYDWQPDELKWRHIDILHKWETALERPLDFVNLLGLLEKDSGG